MRTARVDKAVHPFQPLNIDVVEFFLGGNFFSETATCSDGVGTVTWNSTFYVVPVFIKDLTYCILIVFTEFNTYIEELCFLNKNIWVEYVFTVDIVSFKRTTQLISANKLKNNYEYLMLLNFKLTLIRRKHFFKFNKLIKTQFLQNFLFSYNFYFY